VAESEAFADLTEAQLREVFEAADYVADEDLVTAVFLALGMGKPLLVEGQPGSGKTELGKVLAEGLDTDLVRLQCYEGLAAEHALYEWNYTKQLLDVQARGQGADASPTAGASVFSEEYLFERPLLCALRHEGPTPPVLLIDEVDRADEAFEAFLLEVLSDFQVTIPEYGTVAADQPPVVVITSNRTRGLSDALKRRCLYLHIESPSMEKERTIVERKVPDLDGALAAELCAVAQRLRDEPLRKHPGVAETLDWARAVAQLRADDGDEPLSATEIEHTLGCLLKEVEDVERVDETLLETLVESARTARAEAE